MLTKALDELDRSFSKFEESNDLPGKRFHNEKLILAENSWNCINDTKRPYSYGVISAQWKSCIEPYPWLTTDQRVISKSTILYGILDDQRL